MYWSTIDINFIYKTQLNNGHTEYWTKYNYSYIYSNYKYNKYVGYEFMTHGCTCNILTKLVFCSSPFGYVILLFWTTI